MIESETNSQYQKETDQSQYDNDTTDVPNKFGMGGTYPAVELGLVTSDTTEGVRKEFKLVDDNLTKTNGGGKIYSGEFKNIRLPNGLAGLPNFIQKLTSRQAITLGTAAENGPLRLMVKAKWSGAPGTIARTKENIVFRGRSGFLCFDCDSGLSATEFLQVMGETLPGFEKLGYVLVASSSSYIYNTETGEALRGHTGWHLYIQLSGDMSRYPEIAEDHRHRWWLTKHGQIVKGAINQKTGVSCRLNRGPTDHCTHDPSRLFFEVAPLVHAPLEQRKPAPIYHPGETLNIDAYAFLTAKEVKQAKANLAEAKGEARVEAVESCAQHIVETDGCTVQEATVEAERRISALDRGLVDGNTPIHFQDGSVVLAKDLSAAHTGKRCQNPVEPSYQNGSFCSNVFVNDRGIVIHTYAHGGIQYTVDAELSHPELNAAERDTAYRALAAQMPLAANHRDQLIRCMPEALVDAFASLGYFVSWQHGVEAPTPNCVGLAGVSPVTNRTLAAGLAIAVVNGSQQIVGYRYCKELAGGLDLTKFYWVSSSFINGGNGPHLEGELPTMHFDMGHILAETDQHHRCETIVTCVANDIFTGVNVAYEQHQAGVPTVAVIGDPGFFGRYPAELTKLLRDGANRKVLIIPTPGRYDQPGERQNMLDIKALLTAADVTTEWSVREGKLAEVRRKITYAEGEGSKIAAREDSVAETDQVAAKRRESLAKLTKAEQALIDATEAVEHRVAKVAELKSSGTGDALALAQQELKAARAERKKQRDHRNRLVRNGHKKATAPSVKVARRKVQKTINQLRKRERELLEALQSTTMYSVLWWDQWRPTNVYPGSDHAGLVSLDFYTSCTLDGTAKSIREWKASKTFTGDEILETQHFEYRAPKYRELLFGRGGLGCGKTYYLCESLGNIILEYFPLQKTALDTGAPRYITLPAGVNVLLFGDTNNLTASMAQRLQDHLLTRFNLQIDIVSAAEADFTLKRGQFIYCCPDSLYKIPDNLFINAVVAFDEAESCRDAITNRVEPRLRAKVRQFTTALVKNCGRAFFLDAHLTDQTVDWFLDQTNRSAIKVDHQGNAPADLYLFESKAALRAALERVDARKTPVAIAADDTGIVELAQAVANNATDYAEAYVLSSITNHEPWVQALFTKQEGEAVGATNISLNAWLRSTRPSVFGWTPAAQSGVDISVDLFEYLHCELNGLLNPEKNLQLIGRVRTNVRRKAYLAKQGLWKSASSDQLETLTAQLLKKTMEEVALVLAGETDCEQLIAQMRPIIERTFSDRKTMLDVLRLAELEFERRSLRGCTIYKSLQAGGNVKLVSSQSTPITLNKAVRDARKERNEQFALLVQNAPEITQREFEQLKNRQVPEPGNPDKMRILLGLNPKQRAKRDRFALCDRLPGIDQSLTWEDPKFIDRLLRRDDLAHVHNYLTITEFLSNTRDAQLKTLGFIARKGEAGLSDLRPRLQRHHEMKRLGLDSLLQTRELSEDDLDQAAFTVRRHNIALDINTNRVRNVALIRHLIERYGIQLKSLKDGNFKLINPWAEDYAGDDAVLYRDLLRIAREQRLNPQIDRSRLDEDETELSYAELNQRRCDAALESIRFAHAPKDELPLPTEEEWQDILKILAQLPEGLCV